MLDQLDQLTSSHSLTNSTSSYFTKLDLGRTTAAIHHSTASDWPPAKPSIESKQVGTALGATQCLTINVSSVAGWKMTTSKHGIHHSNHLKFYQTCLVVSIHGGAELRICQSLVKWPANSLRRLFDSNVNLPRDTHFVPLYHHQHHRHGGQWVYPDSLLYI